MITTSLSLMACAICSNAHIDYSFPPFLWWSAIAATCYFGSLVAVPHGGGNPAGYTNSRASRLSYLIPLIIAMIMLGFGPLPLILPFIIYALIRAIRHREHLTRLQRRTVYTTAVLLPLTLLATGVWSYSKAAEKDDVDYVLEWQSTALSRLLLNDMQEQQNLEGLRRVVQEADAFDSATAAEKLAAIGDPQTDADLILSVLKVKAVNPSERRYTTYEKALRKLTGINLPERSSVKQWQDAVNAMQSGAGT